MIVVTDVRNRKDWNYYVKKDRWILVDSLEMLNFYINCLCCNDQTIFKIIRCLWFVSWALFSLGLAWAVRKWQEKSHFGLCVPNNLSWESSLTKRLIFSHTIILINIKRRQWSANYVIVLCRVGINWWYHMPHHFHVPFSDKCQSPDISPTSHHAIVTQVLADNEYTAVYWVQGCSKDLSVYFQTISYHGFLL